MRSLYITISLLSAVILAAPGHAQDTLELKKGDRICYIGNTLADRMQHHGWLETLVQSRFSKQQLVFRNLGFAADELTIRPRSVNFGDPHSHLTHSKADVIFAFFGYNESFGGEAGLGTFRKNLTDFIDTTRKLEYNGKSAPQLVLFSPIAHENIHDPNLPDGSENNVRLQLYSNAMAAIAKEKKVIFVDLFTPTTKLYAKAKNPLTQNGIHLTLEGNQQLAAIIDETLFGKAPKHRAQQLEHVRDAVLTKNLRWFNRYRATDGYSTFGKRAFLKFVEGQTNFTVMQHELKMLDVMTANRDKVVWARAQGKDLEIDDSNVPKPIKVVSNVGGGSRSSNAVKEGSLKYLGGEEAISKMTVAKGMTVNLFASEEQFPDLVNPVQSAVDTNGRLWVSAWTTYPHWHPNEPLNDKLLIFPDEDGDGKADKCIVFADELHNPTGFEFWNGGVLVACAPEILFLKDTDGDDKADVRIHYLQGIDSADTHCGVNGITLGPDGSFYFSEGIFHYTNIESPWGKPLRAAGPVLYRWNPRTQEFVTHFKISPNPHGTVIDEWGHLFATDGTSGRGYYVGYPGKGTPHELYKKRVRPVAGFGMISGTHFPEENRGNLLICNTIGFLGVLQHKVNINGADFTSTEVEPILVSSDKNFRPVDVDIGGDGALYVLDWQNLIIGHMQHNIRDPNRDHVHGRIYRVTADGRPLTPVVKLAAKPIDNVIAQLSSSEHAVRYRARLELSGRDSKKVVEAAQKWARQFDANSLADAHHLLEALWVHEQHNIINTALLTQLLNSPDPRARAAATRVLGRRGDRVKNGAVLLQERARDTDAHVRAEAVVSAVQFPSLAAAEVIFEASQRPTDAQLSYVIKQSRTVLDKYWQDALKNGTKLSPAGQLFALNRASVQDLIKMDHTEGVCRALLSRAGVPRDTRYTALEDLAKFVKKSIGQTLLDQVDEQSKAKSAALGDLGDLFSKLPASDVLAMRKAIITRVSTEGGNAALNSKAATALIEAGEPAGNLYKQLKKSDTGKLAFLSIIPKLSDKIRAGLLPTITTIIEQEAKRPAPAQTQLAAMGRYVRIDMPTKKQAASAEGACMTIAEVQVFANGVNVAPHGKATQSTTGLGVAKRAIDGNTNGKWSAGSCTHTAYKQQNPSWEVDLGSAQPIDRIVVWNRTDCCQERLENFTLSVLDDARQTLFTTAKVPRPTPKVSIKVEGASGTVGDAAVLALQNIPGMKNEVFDYLAQLIAKDVYREAAVSTLRSMGTDSWPTASTPALAQTIAKFVPTTDVKDRDKSTFLNSIALGLALADTLPTAQAEKVRAAITGLELEEIHIKTLAEQMKYDKKEFTVTAGKGVKIVFENADHMPHNLLITDIGALEEVGALADKMAADPEGLKKQYIPDSPKILFATDMVPDHGSFTLKFMAPDKPGDYPFVCTFPGHWRLMKGIMKVRRPATPWASYEGGNGPGKGKHIVFVSGDEEYRSEECLPQLAKILAERHGFTCTVLFAINPETGEIDPMYLNNIPGMEALKTADLMVVDIRFRDLPAVQMQHFDNYLKSGKPVIAIRPTLAGFVIRKHTEYAHYDWHYKGEKKGWQGGFGQAVLGQTWMAHHGKHRHQGTHGLIADSAKSHPVVRGIADGDVWGSSDVYRTPQPVPAGWTVLVNGQVTDRKGAYEPKIPHFGQKPNDPVTKETKKNNPIMPIAWLRNYQIPGGKQGVCFYETIGASADFESEGLRRLTINAACHLVGLPVPAKANVDYIGEYKPTPFGFKAHVKGLRPADHAWPKMQAQASSN